MSLEFRGYTPPEILPEVNFFAGLYAIEERMLEAASQKALPQMLYALTAMLTPDKIIALYAGTDTRHLLVRSRDGNKELGITKLAEEFHIAFTKLDD